MCVREREREREERDFVGQSLYLFEGRLLRERPQISIVGVQQQITTSSSWSSPSARCDDTCDFDHDPSDGGCRHCHHHRRAEAHVRTTGNEYLVKWVGISRSGCTFETAAYYFSKLQIPNDMCLSCDDSKVFLSPIFPWERNKKVSIDQYKGHIQEMKQAQESYQNFTKAPKIDLQSFLKLPPVPPPPTSPPPGNSSLASDVERHDDATGVTKNQNLRAAQQTNQHVVSTLRPSPIPTESLHASSFLSQHSQSANKPKPVKAKPRIACPFPKHLARQRPPRPKPQLPTITESELEHSSPPTAPNPPLRDPPLSTPPPTPPLSTPPPTPPPTSENCVVTPIAQRSMSAIKSKTSVHMVSLQDSPPSPLRPHRRFPQTTTPRSANKANHVLPVSHQPAQLTLSFPPTPPIDPLLQYRRYPPVPLLPTNFLLFLLNLVVSSLQNQRLLSCSA